ncbi:hypothetical protein K144313037_22140 [Clostridium tetani]|uniref:hypothetical protein n=1 Tax=Clostridium tetani TaxID=1513 RepID=UPI0029537D12|nr:hypothetical protein [Clostridium tetani]BDR70802.1 hypothetical protein K144313037_22140 [Clostridium tetani]BEV20440.1 hypothetical protein K154301001_22950 [Clostridium tetani]
MDRGKSYLDNGKDFLNHSPKTIGIYLPDERGYLEDHPKPIRTYSKNKKSSSCLPDNVVDPIVSNHISTWEFDSTSKDMHKNNDLFK